MGGGQRLLWKDPPFRIDSFFCDTREGSAAGRKGRTDRRSRKRVCLPVAGERAQPEAAPKGEVHLLQEKDRAPRVGDGGQPGRSLRAGWDRRRGLRQGTRPARGIDLKGLRAKQLVVSCGATGEALGCKFIHVFIREIKE